MDDALDLRRRAENILGVPRMLHDYQWEGIAFLYRSRAALLADEMGLGKTVQASVALALLLSAQNQVNRALIVTPAALTTNWILELETWAPSLAVRRIQGDSRDRKAFYLLPIPVLVGSYEHIRQDGLDNIPSNSFDIVILDEAQRIKNRDSTTALACRLLPRKYSWALSATPVENDTQDIASILGFLDPSIRSDLSGAELTSKLKTMMLRRRKAEVRDELPPVIVQDLKLELTPSQRSRYDELWANRREAIASSTKDTKVLLLGLLTRLKIICNFDGETSSKLVTLREICEGAESTSRILIFSQFVETLKWISDRISLASDLFTGAMSVFDRETAMERFKTESTPRILFVSLRAGGVGLNLGMATHVIVFDRWWNPAVEIQAIYRAHRFQRDKPLHVIRFLVADTIEERIATILNRKENIFEDVIESTKTSVSRFTAEELRQILDLPEEDIFRHKKNEEENTIPMTREFEI